MDIIVTVGVILLLIVLAALVIHLINAHHAKDVATHHYDPFHPGDPRGGGGASPGDRGSGGESG